MEQRREKPLSPVAGIYHLLLVHSVTEVIKAKVGVFAFSPALALSSEDVQPSAGPEAEQFRLIYNRRHPEVQIPNMPDPEHYGQARPFLNTSR